MPVPDAYEHLRLASTHANLERIVEAAQNFARRHGADEDLAYRFMLVTSEAAANAFEHGHAGDEARHIQVELRATAEALEAAVEDEGEGFDPSSVEDPLDEKNLTRDHGRGLFLISQMADAVHYERGGRRIHMRLHRAPAD